jgi:hypothetical protein
MSREAALLQGNNGYHVVNSGEGAVSGNFRWIQVIQDATFSDITDSTATNVADLENISIAAGIGFGGNITSITVSAGTVLAYHQ